MSGENQFLSDFIFSAREKISQMHELEINLETDSSDLSVIDDLFRLIHTIKGEAALLGLANLKTLSHRIESLMGLARDKLIIVDRLFCDLFATGLGLVGQRVDNIDEGKGETEFSRTENDFLHALEEFITSAEESASSKPSAQSEFPGCGGHQYFFGKFDLSSDICVIQSFFEKCETASAAASDNAEFIGALENLQKVFEDSGAGDKRLAVEQMLADMEMMAGDDGAVDDFLLGMFKENFSKVIEGIHRVELRVEPEVEDGMLDTDDFEEAILQLEQLQNAEAAPAPQPVVPQPQAVQSEPEQAQAKTQKKAEASYRIKDTQLNDILKTVQLFETVKDSFETVKNDLVEFDGLPENVMFNFDEALDNLELFARVLFSMLLKTKVSSPKLLFAKVEKLVESLAHSLGKSVKIKTHGQDLKIDKGILELFEGSLIHIVRNSIDHGIESPEERELKGKPDMGIVEVKLFHEDGLLTLTIEDDGKGIDFAAIRMEAFKKALITPMELNSMSDADAAKLIFMPGISTSVSISEVSGRGVGMNAVLDNIEKVGGNIDVSSKPGEGTLFTITLPVISKDNNFYLRD